MFCVVGVKPLLCNPRAPASVSAGAVHLLTHLHTRLEVLVKDEDVAASAAAAASAAPSNKSSSSSFASSWGLSSSSSSSSSSSATTSSAGDSGDGGDAPVLWESCWLPILRAMADGANDERPAVRAAAVAALTHAISDRHALVVPAGVLVDILGEVVVPTVLLLGQGLVREALGAASAQSEQEQARAAKTLRSQTRDEELLSHLTALTVEGSSDTRAPPAAASSSSLSRALAQPTPIRDLEGSTDELLAALTAAVVRQAVKLHRYPSFDKLWLRVLHMLGFFLGAPHGFDHGVLTLLTQQQQQSSPQARRIAQGRDSLGGGSRESRAAAAEALAACVSVAKDQLYSTMEALSRAGVFKPELQTLGDDIVAQFSCLNGAPGAELAVPKQ